MEHRSTGRIQIGLVALVTAMLVTACSPTTPSSAGQTSAPSASAGPTTTPSSEPIAGGELTVAQGYLPKAIDPAFDTSLFASATYTYVFDTLTVAGANGDLQPSLATEWKATSDTTWEFKLRTDVKFHNGEPFNAAAAKFTIDRILDPDVGSAWVGRISSVTAVEAPSDDTLILTTAQPVANLPQQMTVIFMVPPKYTEEQGLEGFGKAPVGTGPFSVSEWVVDDRLVLERNDDYWGGPAALDRVTLRMIPEESSRLAALETGEADIAFPISPDQADRVDALPETSLETSNLGQSLVVAFRAVDTGPISDPLVRQALNYAIDKQALIDTLMHGQGRLLDGQLATPETFGFNPDLEPYPYDPDLARDMLADAGYPDGFDVVFQGPTGRYTQDQAVGEAIAAQLGEVGVRTSYEVLESGTFISSWLDGTIGPLYLWGWNLAPAMSVDQPMPYHRCGVQWKLLCNEEFDELYAAQAAEFDVDRRRELLQDLSALYREEAASLFLWQLPFSFGINDRVTGFAANPDGTINLRELSVAP